MFVGQELFHWYPTLLLGEDGRSTYKIDTCTLKTKTSEKKRILPNYDLHIIHGDGGVVPLQRAALNV